MKMTTDLTTRPVSRCERLRDAILAAMDKHIMLRDKALRGDWEPNQRSKAS